MATHFWQLVVPIQPDLGERISTLFEEWALSSSWYEPEEGKPWQFQAIFTENPDQQRIEQLLKEVFGLTKAPPYTISLLPEVDWLAMHHKFCPPLEIGPFYIYNSYLENINKPPHKIPLEINASLAFGSGHHETTQGCLEAIARITAMRQCQHPLDVGCGSGILALATAALLQIPVVACDNDPQAVEMTKENAKMNKIAPLIKAYISEGMSSSEVKMSGPYDLIMANILANPLCELAKSFASHLITHGILILSGLLKNQASQVIETYAQYHCYLLEEITIGNWSTLILEKRQNG